MSANAGVETLVLGGGVGQGPIANQLLKNNMDPGVLRPMLADDGRSFITVANGVDAQGKAQHKSITTNAVATLRVREWIELDQAILRAARPRLRAVGDLRSAGLTYALNQGMAKTVHQYQRVTDVGQATVSMDGLRKGKGDRPEFDLTSIPLPIIHSDFSFSARDIAVSRNGGQPIDMHTAENAARRVADRAERMLLGLDGGWTYGGGNIYGYTTFPNRQTYSMQDPTSVGWVPAKTLTDILAMKQASMLAFHYGPWMLYTSPKWDQYLDGDYTAAYSTGTLRERLKKIEGILDVRTLDFLPDYTMLMVQFNTDTVDEIIGMDITTIQWQEEGGMELFFKVMCIMVPRIRADINLNCGLVHGTV